MKKINGKLRDVLDMRVTELMSDHRLNETQAQRMLAEILAGSVLNAPIWDQGDYIMDNHPEWLETNNFGKPEISVESEADAFASMAVRELEAA